jgi:RNA polymerase sigma-70 factor (ECF subfamily)
MKFSEREKQVRFKADMVPHMDVLFNYALYTTGDRDMASDLLQDTFLKAFRFFDKFESGTNAKAWLYRIMRNTYINEYRRINRLPDHVVYDEQLSAHQMYKDFVAVNDDLRKKIEGEMFGDEVATAIASLPEKFKSVVILRDLEDLPYEEIAEVLDIPIGTVRSRLHRARALLFSSLKDYARTHGFDVSDSLMPDDYALAS